MSERDRPEVRRGSPRRRRRERAGASRECGSRELSLAGRPALREQVVAGVVLPLVAGLARASASAGPASPLEHRRRATSSSGRPEPSQAPRSRGGSDRGWRSPWPRSRCRRGAPRRPRLTLSKNSVQSNADISRMLVITLRTVTFIAAWRWCSTRTISSAVVPWAARRSSSQRSAGVTAGSWSRRRWTSWTANGGRAARRSSNRRSDRRRRLRRRRRRAPSRLVGQRVGLLARRLARARCARRDGAGSRPARCGA